MKKLLYMIAFLVGMFCFIPATYALTNIEFQQTNNGTIKTSLHFEEGFVGGIELVLKIDGDVSVSKFAFDSKINNSNFTKDYTYDAKAKTLTIRITSGGIGTSHNLLNANKELSLGTITFSTSAKSSVKYSLTQSNLVILDNNWNSQTIEKEHITLGDNNKFTYTIAVKEENTETPSGNQSSEIEDDSKNDKNKDDSKEESTKEEDKNADDDKKDNDENSSSSDSTSENNSNKETSSKEESTKKESDSNIFPIIIGAVSLLAIGSFIGCIYIMKKEK